MDGQTGCNAHIQGRLNNQSSIIHLSPSRPMAYFYQQWLNYCKSGIKRMSINDAAIYSVLTANNCPLPSVMLYQHNS